DEDGAREQEEVQPEKPDGGGGGGKQMHQPRLQDPVTPGREGEDARTLRDRLVDVPIEGGQDEPVVLGADPQAENQDPDGGAQGQEESLEHPTVRARYPRSREDRLRL